MAHEDLSREHVVKGSSDRAFGLVFAAVFLLVGAWPLVHGGLLRWWALVLAAAFALITVTKPQLLASLNRLWIRLGGLLSKVVSPLALGLLFYAVLAPLGVCLRLAGKDPLKLNRAPQAASYWVPRQPPGPPPDSMTNQF